MILFGVPEMSLSSQRGFRGVRSVVLLTILIIAIVLVNLTKSIIMEELMSYSCHFWSCGMLHWYVLKLEA